MAAEATHVSVGVGLTPAPASAGFGVAGAPGRVGPLGFGTIVVSLLTVPGGLVAYAIGLITIWSISAPSSRVCTRTVCEPVFWNHTSPVSASQYALRCQPQPKLWQVAHVHKFTV